MTVTSPGGFIGGVGVTNIITHPAVPRYRSLAEAMAALRLAEREGIGVDRMIRDMLAIGRPAPGFYEVRGPYVRVSLTGGEPTHEMISFLDATEPEASEEDVDLLLIVEHLIVRGWIDARSAAPVLQRSVTESGAALTVSKQSQATDRRSSPGCSTVSRRITHPPTGSPTTAATSWPIVSNRTERPTVAKQSSSTGHGQEDGFPRPKSPT